MKNPLRRWTIRPVLVMVALLGAVLLANQGMPLQVRPAILDYLSTNTVAAQAGTTDAGVLVAYDPEVEAEAACALSVTGMLEQLHIAWRSVPLDETLTDELPGAKTLLVCSQDLTPVASCVRELINWVTDGGRLGLMMVLRDNDTFDILSHKLGVAEHSNQYQPYGSLRYVADILPLWETGKAYSANGAITDYTLPVRLEDDCAVYMETAEDNPFVLMWSRDIGKGRVLVNNNTLIQHKDSRGFSLSAYLLLQDTVLYPIINAGMVFIDDFPAPQPSGVDEALLAQYGYDIQGFYRNHWWPNMKSLALANELRYTGVLIETYNDTVSGPFEPDTKQSTLIRYYMSELLQTGGEVGLHGYNHQPLCPDGFQYSGENYKTWSSAAMMAASLKELSRYGSKFLTNTAFRTYVPPSNYLSDEGKATLLKTLPEIRTVSGVYYPETGTNALVQEFCEEKDGSVSVPRITSGFILDEYNGMRLAQELMLHGVFSHFIHPDDVLDSDRGADAGWAAMYEGFSETIQKIISRYPQLRWSTASEGAAAVQRYDRLSVTCEETDNGLSVALSPYYDTTWLALKTPHAVRTVENGECFSIADNFYWVRADGPELNILWEDGT
ncbi:MAG: DUF2194 domain-containing protein [Eubacteriales bacterium]|nr:DUF2194 domain-containing protein [Eubacteriales bacterium]